MPQHAAPLSSYRFREKWQLFPAESASSFCRRTLLGNRVGLDRPTREQVLNKESEPAWSVRTRGAGLRAPLDTARSRPMVTN